MNYIKLYEDWNSSVSEKNFSKDEWWWLNDPSKDDLKKISVFLKVLDFPRQNPEGYITSSGEISISKDVKGREYEPGYDLIVEYPEILNDPDIKKEMKDNLIGGISIDQENDTISIDYLPMSKSDYYNNNYDDDGLTYKQYLEYF